MHYGRPWLAAHQAQGAYGQPHQDEKRRQLQQPDQAPHSQRFRIRTAILAAINVRSILDKRPSSATEVLQ
jgi:hypothetical protein